VPNKHNAPLLAGWLTLQQVAERLRVSRQAVHQAAEDEVFQTLCRTGGDRPVWLVADHEIRPGLVLGPSRERRAALDSRRAVSSPEAEADRGAEHDSNSGEEETAAHDGSG